MFFCVSMKHTSKAAVENSIVSDDPTRRRAIKCGKDSRTFISLAYCFPYDLFYVCGCVSKSKVAEQQQSLSIWRSNKPNNKTLTELINFSLLNSSSIELSLLIQRCGEIFKQKIFFTTFAKCMWENADDVNYYYYS